MHEQPETPRLAMFNFICYYVDIPQDFKIYYYEVFKKLMVALYCVFVPNFTATSDVITNYTTNRYKLLSSRLQTIIYGQPIRKAAGYYTSITSLVLYSTYIIVILAIFNKQTFFS